MPPRLQYEVQPHDIVAGLATLGLRAGDVVLVHCAVSSLGRVVGGINAVVGTLLELLGPVGTLMVPTHTDLTLPFSPETSPSIVGELTETVRRLPGAIRSKHPTHSVAALGPQADYLTRGHEAGLPCGPESPYGRLCQLSGWVLLLGVDQDRSTVWHTAETVADVPYLPTLTVPVAQVDGCIQTVRVPKSPWGHREFIKLDRPLREAGLMNVGRVGLAAARLIRADKMVAFGVERLRQLPAAFLCEKPRCSFCQWARWVLQGRASAIDWCERSARWGCTDPRCEVCVV